MVPRRRQSGDDDLRSGHRRQAVRRHQVPLDAIVRCEIEVRTPEVDAVPGARAESRRLVGLPVPVRVPQRQDAPSRGLVSDEHIAVGRNRNVPHSGRTARRGLGVVDHHRTEAAGQIQAAIVGIADRANRRARSRDPMGCLDGTGRPAARLGTGHHRSDRGTATRILAWDADRTSSTTRFYTPTVGA